MDPIAMLILETERSMNITALHRPENSWSEGEFDQLKYGLMTPIIRHPQHPEYVLFEGHCTKERIVRLVGDVKKCHIIRAIGINDKRLPFRPTFD